MSSLNNHPNAGLACTSCASGFSLAALGASEGSSTEPNPHDRRNLPGTVVAIIGSITWLRSPDGYPVVNRRSLRLVPCVGGQDELNS
jgi:hypothetical protein